MVETIPSIRAIKPSADHENLPEWECYRLRVVRCSLPRIHHFWRLSVLKVELVRRNSIPWWAGQPTWVTTDTVFGTDFRFNRTINLKQAGWASPLIQCVHYWLSLKPLVVRSSPRLLLPSRIRGPVVYLFEYERLVTPSRTRVTRKRTYSVHTMEHKIQLVQHRIVWFSIRNHCQWKRAHHWRWHRWSDRWREQRWVKPASLFNLKRRWKSLRINRKCARGWSEVK